MPQWYIKEVARVPISPELAVNSRIKVRGGYTLDLKFNNGATYDIPAGVRVKAMLSLVRVSGAAPVSVYSNILRWPKLCQNEIGSAHLFDITNHRIEPGLISGEIQASTIFNTATASFETEPAGSPTHTHTITLTYGADLDNALTLNGIITDLVVRQDRPYMRAVGSATVEAIITSNADTVPTDPSCVALVVVAYAYDGVGYTDGNPASPYTITNMSNSPITERAYADDGTTQFKWPGTLIAEMERCVPSTCAPAPPVLRYY